MAIVESDNPRLEGLLKTLESLVEEAGGGLHSELLIESKGGNLAVRTKEPMKKGKEIIRLTRKALLPEDIYDIGVSGDEFTLNYHENSFISDLQKRLIENMIEIYNATDKVKLHREYSFLLSLRDQKRILEKLREGRFFPGKLGHWADKMDDLDDPKTMNEFMAETFLKTRHLGYNDHVRVTNVSIIMPVVDFLNHHTTGASFAIANHGVRAGDLTVGAAQPHEGSTECYAFYGVMDAFDTFIRYDFIDENAHMMRSIPVDLKTPTGNTIKIDARPGGVFNKKMDKKSADLKLYMPNVKIDGDDKDVMATHILIPSSKSPRSMRRVLALLLGYCEKAQNLEKSQIEQWIGESEVHILDQNKKYYGELKSMAEAELKTTPDHAGIKSVLHLTALQLEHLNKYEEIIQSIEQAA